MRRFWFFDLDGTLADTEPDIKKAWRDTLRDLSLPADHFEERFVTGPSIDEVTKLLYPDRYTPELSAAIRAGFGAHYDHDGFPNTREYPGVLDAVRRVKAGGAAAYIATNKRLAGATPMARKFGWDSVFDGLYTGDMHRDDPIGKLRKPELLALVMRDLGAAPKDCVMVGDTVNDFEAAKANGVRSIGVSWGYGKPDELAKADSVATTPEDLV